MTDPTVYRLAVTHTYTNHVDLDAAELAELFGADVAATVLAADPDDVHRLEGHGGIFDQLVESVSPWTGTSVYRLHRADVDPDGPADDPACTCVILCDPDYVCPLVNVWHVHPDAPCPVHPDAPTAPADLPRR